MFGVKEFGEEYVPMMLVFGVDIMYDMFVWVCMFCGVDVVVCYFDYLSDEVFECEVVLKVYYGIVLI